MVQTKRYENNTFKISCARKAFLDKLLSGTVIAEYLNANDVKDLQQLKSYMTTSFIFIFNCFDSYSVRCRPSISISKRSLTPPAHISLVDFSFRLY